MNTTTEIDKAENTTMPSSEMPRHIAMHDGGLTLDLAADLRSLILTRHGERLPWAVDLRGCHPQPHDFRDTLTFMTPLAGGRRPFVRPANGSLSPRDSRRQAHLEPWRLLWNVNH